MKNPQIFTSEKEYWETPQTLFNLLDSIFHFALDAAADDKNYKCDIYFTKEQDSLKQDWTKAVEMDPMWDVLDPMFALRKSVWLNPPFGRGGKITKWMKKCYEESLKGTTVCALVAARTDTKFFKVIWERARYICFFYGRLVYELEGSPILDDKGNPMSATFPSALAVFSPRDWDLTKLAPLAKIIKNTI